MSSARHALSPLLPSASGLAALLRALQGRVVVVNNAPIAVCAQQDAALVRGLVGAALAGESAALWVAAPRGMSARWPADSRTAYEQTLAHGWLAEHDGMRTFGGLGSASVRLFEGPIRIATSLGGGIGPEHARDVRERIAAGIPGRTLALARVIATTDYDLVVVSSGCNEPGDRSASKLTGLDSAIRGALAAGQVIGPATGTVWFSGSVLLPDTATVAAMDVASRGRWAVLTGRAGGRDAYWHPDSWSRFIEPGGKSIIVSSAGVARSTRESRGLSPFSPDTERSAPVPPGYCLVDCVGRLRICAVTI